MIKIIESIFKTLFCFAALFAIYFFLTESEAHRPSPPTYIGSMVEPFRHEGLYIEARAYNARDSETYLSRNLLSKGYQPVQLTIQNNTGKTYFLSKNGVDLPAASAQKVSSYVIKHYIPRSIAMKVASFFFWPFVFPSVVDTIVTWRHHAHMKEDYMAKTLKEQEPLIPYSTTHRILFVPRGDYSDHFTLHLREAKTGRNLSFEISA
jgi:hypothetical protein